MEAEGNNNGGFHGYRSLLQTTTSASRAGTDTKGPGPAQPESECTIREQDRFMPIANVIRIMRKILPPHAKISDDAKETIQECVSEFISFITSEANERCQREQRKTITAEDVLWAMSKLGFDDYIEPLTVYLHRFRDLDGGDRGSIRGEPLVLKRMMAEHGSGFQAYPAPPASASAAAFHHMAHRQGFFRGQQINFFKETENGGSSKAAAEGFPQCKE